VLRKDGVGNVRQGDRAVVVDQDSEGDIARLERGRWRSPAVDGQDRETPAVVAGVDPVR
jgi:hypothetical protein